MKTTIHLNSLNSNLLKITFDVGKDHLYAYTELPLGSNAHKAIEEVLPNRNEPILKVLAQFKSLATEQGLNGVCILCEPTGGYERRLLRLARQAGHFTAYLNAESVHKLRVVQSNDPTKSDQKDPKTMFTLVKLGKTLTHRQLSGPWLLLRETHAYYQIQAERIVALRAQIQRVLIQLFCEFSFKKDFLFKSPAISPLLQEFGLNPYRIVAAGQSGFLRRMKKHKVALRTLERLWEDAQRSVLQQLDPGYSDLLELTLREFFEDFGRSHQRLDAAAQKLVDLLHQLQAQGQIPLQARKGLINELLLARVLAETGPLKDFQTWSQLLRYAGMNLCERQSGTMVGQRHISKKGRAALRKVLAQAVLPLVRKTDLYGTYYHAKKADGMEGQKAMMAVARKFLKLLWGLNRSAQDFATGRVFTCQSQFQPTCPSLAQAA